MEKSAERPLYRCSCCRDSGSRGSEPLFLAVYKNNLNDLKSLIACGQSANTRSIRGNTLLNYVIEHNRVEIFNWLLSLPDIQIDCVDSLGRSPLLHAVANAADPFFALTLMANGADVSLRDDEGATALHLAARHATEDSLRVGQAVIQRGADVDALWKNGESPLYVACRGGNVDFAYMLLYFGADATLSREGVLPLVVVSPSLPPEHRSRLEDILFDHTFDEGGRSVRLPTLVKAMTRDFSLFQRIMDPTPDVTYDKCDLEYLFDRLLSVKARHFRLFIEKLGHIVKEMIENFPPLSTLTGFSLDMQILDVSELKELLYVFLESDYVSEFVQTSDSSYPIVGHLVQMFSPTGAFNEDMAMKTSCLMLSYGLTLTSADLDIIYSHFGYCEFFKILLFMDIKMEDGGNVMAAIYYDPKINLESILSTNVINLLRYFNDTKLKERFLREFDGEIASKVKLLPTVPYLIELARNEARKFIMEKYKIKNSCQFYTVIRWLPIGEVYKRIITFEKKLYIV